MTNFDYQLDDPTPPNDNHHKVCSTCGEDLWDRDQFAWSVNNFLRSGGYPDFIRHLGGCGCERSGDGV